MITEGEHLVCERCLSIDFQTLIRPLPSDLCPRLNRVYCTLQYTQGCAVCELLFPFSYKGVQIDAHSITSHAFPEVKQPPPGTEKSFVLKVNTGAGISTGALVYCVHNSIDADLFVQPTWDYTKAKSWLRDCMTSHNSQCGNSATKATNVSLIDCATMTIVEADDSSRWIALSYVWGERAHTTPPTAKSKLYVGSRLPSTLPRTVEDAITVTQRLGYRFLWVDEYCIDQQDTHKQHAQIGQMDEVYRGADLTIVAAAGEGRDHGLPGVNKTRRRRVQMARLKNVTLFANPQFPGHVWEARWFTRAWTLQEGLLSRRVLLFTNQQTTFFCKTKFSTEGLGEYLTTMHGGHFDHVRNARVSLPTPRDLSKAEVALTHFKTLLQLYTSRNLTFVTDSLNAFRGVMRDMRRLQPTAYNLSGLPFFRALTEGEDSTWAGLVGDTLAWYHRDDLFNQHGADFKSRRRSLFPSWTWAGWSGAIWFPSLYMYSSTVKVLSDVRLESSDGTILSETALQQHSQHDTVQDALDTVTFITFEAPMLSAEEYSAIASELHDSIDNSISSKIVWQGPDSELVKNLRWGIWSCFLITVNLSGEVERRNSFINILVVEWKEDGVSAERIWAYCIRFRLPLEEVLGPIENFERRKVRLM